MEAMEYKEPRLGRLSEGLSQQLASCWSGSANTKALVDKWDACMRGNFPMGSECAVGVGASSPKNPTCISGDSDTSDDAGWGYCASGGSNSGIYYTSGECNSYGVGQSSGGKSCLAGGSAPE